MTDNPYQPPTEPSIHSEARKRNLRGGPSSNHRFWIGLALCPIYGPILTVFGITLLGLIYQTSGMDGSAVTNPMSLIFFPIFGLLIGIPINYVAMGLTFFPLIIAAKNRNKLNFRNTMMNWLASVMIVMIVTAFGSTLSSIAFDKKGMSEGLLTGFSSGIFTGMLFALVSLVSAISFWYTGVRGNALLITAK